jgi:hypothetical protein
MILLLIDNIFVHSHKNVQVVSGSVIQKYRYTDPDSVGNIYGSRTLVFLDVPVYCNCLKERQEVNLPQLSL